MEDASEVHMAAEMELDKVADMAADKKMRVPNLSRRRRVALTQHSLLMFFSQ